MKRRRKCGCVIDGQERRYWKHVGPSGHPEDALCEPFGGCSHPCPHDRHRTTKATEEDER